MKKTTCLLLLTVCGSLCGCGSFLKSPTEDVDVKNSPCACNYSGRQLYAPTDNEKICIIREIRGVSA